MVILVFMTIFPSVLGASHITSDAASSLGETYTEELKFTLSGLREVQMCVVFRS